MYADLHGSIWIRPPGLLHTELTEAIIGVFYNVYNELGHGFLESVYREAMLIALWASGLQAEKEVAVDVKFRNHSVGKFYADILVDGRVLLELKAARNIESAHEAQLLHYLKSTEMEIGLVLNFGPRPQFRRLVFGNDRKAIRVYLCISAAKGSA